MTSTSWSRVVRAQLNTWRLTRPSRLSEVQPERRDAHHPRARLW